MNRKSSAHYQREYRRRLREQGLVKKEVWIRPEHSKTLSAVEETLRTSAELSVNEEIMMPEITQLWTTDSLYRALSALPVVNHGDIELSLIDGIEPVICLSMAQFGDLPLYLTIAGEQILVDAWLWPISDVRDPADFNDAVLRSHKLFPLSTISLETLETGESYYSLFGALSSQSKLDSIVIEVETLARNVMQVTEAYSPYLVSYAQGEA